LQPIPPSQIHAFYGTDVPTAVLQEEQSSAEAQTSYKANLAGSTGGKQVQDNGAATQAFYGIDAVKPEHVV